MLLSLHLPPLTEIFSALKPMEVFYIGGPIPLPAPLTAEEERALLTRLPQEGEYVRQTLIERNLRLVVFIARKFENTGVMLEDLISIGTIGLIKAVNTFDPVKKIKLAPVLDLILIGFLIGQSIGRWGNFMNREAFGAATDAFSRMGLYNMKTESWEFYHPTFLYESLWNLCGFVLLHFLSKKRKYDGQIALGYAAWYGLGRCIIEGLRVDSLWWGPFRVSQVLAGITCVAAVAALLYLNTKPHDPASLWVNRIAMASPGGKLSSGSETDEECGQ